MVTAVDMGTYYCLAQLLLKPATVHIRALVLQEYHQAPRMLIGIWKNNTFVEVPHDEIVVTEEYKKRSISSYLL